MERGSIRGEVLYRSHSQHQRQYLTWIFQNPGLSNPLVPCIRDWHSPVPSWSAQGTMEVSADRSVSWSTSCNTGVQKAQLDEVQRQIKYRQSLKEVKATDLEAEHLQGHQVLLTYHLPTHLSVCLSLFYFETELIYKPRLGSNNHQCTSFPGMGLQAHVPVPNHPKSV